MNEKLIIEKLKEIISYYIEMTRKISTPYVVELESDIAVLESSEPDKHVTAEEIIINKEMLKQELLKYELFHKNSEENSVRWINDYLKYRKA